MKPYCADLTNEQINLTRDGRITVRFDKVRMNRMDLLVAVHGLTPSEVLRSAFDAACIQLGVVSDKA